MAVSIFNLVAQGNGSVGTEAWINLGVIPTGGQIWVGGDSLCSIDKVLTFEIRGNTVGQSAGTLNATSLLASASVKSGATVNQDLYRKGRMILRTVVGTGVENWWLHLKSKSATSGDYMYSIYYTNY